MQLCSWDSELQAAFVQDKNNRKQVSRRFNDWEKGDQPLRATFPDGERLVEGMCVSDLPAPEDNTTGNRCKTLMLDDRHPKSGCSIRVLGKKDRDPLWVITEDAWRH
eukprot:6418409-Alexandrium_andersonii.AAC.1